MDKMTDEIELKTLDRAREQLATMLELVERGQVRCSAATKKPTAATMRMLAEALPGGDFYADEHLCAFAWPLLLQAGGLASGTKLELTAKGRTALKKDPDEVLLGLWDRWVKAGVIDELSRIEAVKGQRRTNVLSGLKNRRFMAAEVLSVLSVNEFTMVTQAHSDSIGDGAHFTVVRNDMAAFKLYIEDPQYGSLGYDHVDFEGTVDRRYLMVLLFEYAATLGLVDVRYVDSNLALDDYEDFWGTEQLTRLSRYDGLRAVRLTTLGQRAKG